jgi:hypothetical protein
LGWRPPPPSPPPPRWLAASAPFLLADRSAPRVSLGGIRCGGARIWCGRWVRVWVPWACACVNARRVFGEKPQRLGRDVGRMRRRGHVAGSTRTARSWRGHGEAGRGRVSRHGCARTRAGPGIPGPRRGRAVRGAPASRARGTTQRRRGDGGCGDDGGATGPCTKRRHGGRRGMGGPTAGLRRVHRHRRQQRGKGRSGGGEAHRQS